MAEDSKKSTETLIKIETLKELNDGIAQIRPQPWEALPDIELYMDQVLKYMPRQKVEIAPDDALTASMVSNYVKSGIMPGANGKRYGREHLVYLTAIQTLKHVLSVKNTSELIRVKMGEKSAQEFYEEYAALMEQTLSGIDLMQYIEEDDYAEDGEHISAAVIGRLAFDFAVMSYSGKLVCERLLELLGREQADAAELLAAAERAAKEKSKEKNKEKNKEQ